MTSGGPNFPTLWSGGSTINLGSLEGLNGAAFGINNAGQVVGWSNTASANGGAIGATLWSGSSIINLNTFLPPGNVDPAYAYGINNLGQIVVDAYYGVGQPEAFLLTPNGPISGAPGPIPGTGLLSFAVLALAGAMTRMRGFLSIIAANS